ncbi:flagellar biosynthesis protein FlhB [Polynucleobacter paneuropaeus]|nr:flagellar biosynthesis protein FlhB [Polynucleobacter paneuropaeus]QWD44887.1 flagellar biosynthesis protein FlhB [Polynucleobacter paneuropaeus]QWD46673.1 flagellar biosynthesis protein FlhB [Polynucleobacter paneuropaeus]
MSDNSKAKALQQAVAQVYEHGDFAPQPLEAGRGIVAEQIIDTAKEHQLFTHESAELVNLLVQVDLDDRIPTEMYRAIAEVLAWIEALERQA